jgi:UDP-N-acetylglucosamine 2-epimerase (non-hydrolysing)
MKIAPLLRAIAKHNEANKLNELVPVLVHTGQHYDYEMSQVFFQDLELPKPDIYLGVGSGTHAEQTAKVMIEFEKVLLNEKPDLVVVVGDVNSTLAAALAAVKLHIPVAHVEAGLRSFDREMPEEINRLLTDQIADYLFTPSADADENLRREGIPQEKIFFVGNVMVDSLLYSKPLAEKSNILERLGLVTNRESPVTSQDLRITNHQSLITDYALLTLHRPSNVDDKESLTGVMRAVAGIAERIPVVFPAHPRTQKKLGEFGISLAATVITRLDELSKPNELGKGLLIIPPLGYLDFLKLEMRARFVMTDSGGIQEETTVLNVPCLTLRDTTERPITITEGTNVLVGNSSGKIIEEASRILDSRSPGASRRAPALWDGMTAQRIVATLAEAV